MPERFQPAPQDAGAVVIGLEVAGEENGCDRTVLVGAKVSGSNRLVAGCYPLGNRALTEPPYDPHDGTDTEYPPPVRYRASL